MIRGNMVCKRCGKEFDVDWRRSKKVKRTPCLYCSTFCAHSREVSEETKNAISAGVCATMHYTLKYCVVCGKKLNWRNKSGMCQECKPPAKTQSEIISEHRRRRKKALVEYKGGKCERCGYDRYIGALGFHHIDPSTKSFSLSSSGTTKSWERDKAEVDKCILVCYNCHLEIHAEMRAALLGDDSELHS